MNIQWYPGHMTKARRMMEENIKLVDVVIEILDARVPISSRNPEMNKIIRNKPRIFILNKIDLADEKRTQLWYKRLNEEGDAVVLINAKRGKGINSVLNAVREVCKEKIERNKKRGLINKPIRAMVVGIPNVGKSTFINKLVGSSSAKTGNKPGVTKGKQWIKLKKDIELLDTPGLLWPKFEDKEVGIKLALIGSIKEDILDRRELAYKMIEFMQRNYIYLFTKKYEIDEFENKPSDVVLEEVTMKRNILMSGGIPDIDRMAIMLLDEFRNGKFGRMTLESIEDNQ